MSQIRNGDVDLMGYGRVRCNDRCIHFIQRQIAAAEVGSCHDQWIRELSWLDDVRAHSLIQVPEGLLISARVRTHI